MSGYHARFKRRIKYRVGSSVPRSIGCTGFKPLCNRALRPAHSPTYPNGRRNFAATVQPKDLAFAEAERLGQFLCS